MRAEGADGLTRALARHAREVRGLHEELFYRPLLPATAQLSTGGGQPRPGGRQGPARGHRLPRPGGRHAAHRGADRGGVAPGGDPAPAAPGDARLVRGRRGPGRRACWRSGGCRDELGTTHWYLKLLRDSGTAAARLAQVLSTSRYVADALHAGRRSPSRWLADDADLVPRTFERLTAEADAILTPLRRAGRRRSRALRGLRRRELARTAAADVLGVVDRGARVAEPERRGRRRPASARCAWRSGRRARTRAWRRARPGCSSSRWAGWGGAEMGYGSDADVLFVHDPVAGRGPAGGAGVRAAW